MGEPNSTGLAAAVAGGYVLGRTRKGRLALTAAAVLLGSGLSPRDLLAAGLRRTGGAADDEKSGGIAQAARTAVSGVANRRITALTEALREHTLALSGEQDDTGDKAEDGDGGDEASAEGAEGAADETDAAGESTPEQAHGPDGNTAGLRRARRRESASRTPRPAAKRTAAKKTPPGEAAAPKKRSVPGKQAVPAKKTASGKGPAGKTSSAGRPAAKKGEPTRKSASRPGRER
ncbi:hypothetical protein OG552_32490 [Streptomyces sp. NBC_01476]|uniref:hypothetical protein n=1 Tax=Streptomyces sp. NBC_01476 TaxID=2903881 RepID=UPI002E353D0B|nr:hypothetical protein [Streptomyces sp. NBC_01476]